VQLAHKIELKENNTQRTYFKKGCGTFRFVWNWGLAEWNKQFQAGEKPSGMKLKKEFNAIKREEYPWTYEVTKYASQQPFLDLQDAWSRFFKKLAEKPTFKQKGKCRDSFYVGGDQIKVKGRRLWIPNLGWVRMREELRFQGKINSVVISRTADRWFASIQVDSPIQFPKYENQMPVGIDVGINHLAMLSTGIAFEAPKPLRALLFRLKRASRKLSKKLKGSKNSQKQKMKLAKLHARIANIRKDILHKITTWIAEWHSDVGLEDLNIQGMMSNHKLARSISDLGLYEFKRQLRYKLDRREGTVHVFDRFYPSSKKCSAPNCTQIKKELPLSERIYSCQCGLQLDRDLNASRNLNPIPKVIRKYTPVEMAALKKQVGLVFSTSICEAGNQHQVA
jgi:putative transposase